MPAKQLRRPDCAPMARSRTSTANKANKIAHAAEQPSRRSARIAARQALDATSTDKLRGKKKRPPVTTMNEHRRNPKRKAAETPALNYKLPDNLLEEALRPLSPREIEEWEGWIEIESDPAFFDIILRELGIKDVKAQELFTLDDDSLAMLPKPVYGLIFLFQYSPLHDEHESEDFDGSVWFANQTTSNACATVALLNIMMNHNDVEIGDELQKFKTSTKDLSTALRGYQLDRNDFIRKTHNAFARRMDILNSDLYLENDASSSKSKKRSKASRKKRSSKKRDKTDYGFHFIAYVPSDGHVWELDGLRGRPNKLGSIDGGDWTAIARPQIEARMLQYEEDQLAFNLVALCQSPLQQYATSVASVIANIQFLDAEMAGRYPEYSELISADSSRLNISDPFLLSEFDISKDRIDKAAAAESFKARISNGGFTVKDAYELRQQLLTDALASIGEYRAEVLSVAEHKQRVTARKKDYGSVLHTWVSKLAEKGVLEDVIKTAS